MALDTYSDLVSSGSNWSARYDSDMADRIPEFIELTEAKINRKLRTRDMETQDAAFAISAEYVALPTGFGGVRSFYLNDTNKTPLEYVAIESLPVGTGTSRYYTIEGDSFRFGYTPSGSDTATLTYFLTVPALTGAAPTNWLMTNHPDAYVYGVQAELANLAKDYPTADRYEGKMYAVLQEIISSSKQDKWAGNSMTTRLG